MTKWDEFIDRHTDQYEEEKLRILKTQKCPHIKRKHAGDEFYDLCEITERPSGRIKPCLLESGNDCEIWQEIQGEWLKEEKLKELDDDSNYNQC